LIAMGKQTAATLKWAANAQNSLKT
jgi:hypothetical protein